MTKIEDYKRCYVELQEVCNMAVSYKKLWIKLAENSMSKAELRKKAEIAPNTMTKLRKNEYVAMPILSKICKTLDVDYGDIMEYVPDDEIKTLEKICKVD